ncbi:hypothetical protein BD414DRAFT_483911 [Trametes punicea]|nr:hypothetical protein BD414DRAFT_483911 [Trametes punicea]
MEAQAHPINAGPSGSQASATRLFVDSAGRPLRVFVEAAELLNRPRVIRTLKNNGAQISHSPEEAAVILVDPETASGTQFVQEWGSEPGKVVLDVSWVQESLERGKALLADENWGGFSTTPNTSGSVQNPLPTPRETPPDAQAAQANMQNQIPYPPPDGSQFAPGTLPPGYPFQQHPQVVQQLHNNLPSGAAIPMATMQTNPNAQVTLPAQLVAQLVGLVSQQGLHPASLGLPQMVPQPPMNMMQGQPIPQGYPQQAISFMSHPSVFSPSPFTISQQSASYNSQQMMNPPLSQMQSLDGGASSQYHSPTPATPDALSSSVRAGKHSSMSESMRDSPMDDIRSPSLKRKSPSMDRVPSTSSRSKAGMSRTDSEHSMKHRRVSHPIEEPLLPFPEASPVLMHTRREPSSPQGRKLFAKENEEPYKFFVQVDIRPRTKIADAIKKNGGKLVPDIADADFVILGAPSTRTFEERLKQAGNYEKVAVRPQWVFACVEQNAIVDPDEFSFERLHVEKRRGRPSLNGKRLVITGSASKSKTLKKDPGSYLDEDDDVAEEDEVQDTLVNDTSKVKGKAKAKAEKSKASASERLSKTGAKSKATSAKPKERTASPKAFWRPSPPPPTRVVEHMPGKNMYTKEDLDYVDEYLPILFFRDPDMTLFSVAEKLYAKMPHHTMKSWQTFISHATRREKVEKMRRQAQIARRKAAASSQEVSEQVDADTLPQTTEGQRTDSTARNTDVQASGEFDAFTVLTKFFAGGGADNLADVDVWRVLSQKHPEMSPEGWETYWFEHNEAISAAVAELSGLQGGDPEPASEAPMQVVADQKVPKPEPD